MRDNRNREEEEFSSETQRSPNLISHESTIFVEGEELTKFLQHHILKPLVGHKLHSGVENGENVVRILGVTISCLQKYFHFPQILALFQQRNCIIFTPKKFDMDQIAKLFFTIQFLSPLGF